MSIVQICVTCRVGPCQQGQVKTLTLTLCNFIGYPCAYQPWIRSHFQDVYFSLRLGHLGTIAAGGVHQNVSQIFLPPVLRSQKKSKGLPKVFLDNLNKWQRIIYSLPSKTCRVSSIQVAPGESANWGLRKMARRNLLGVSAMFHQQNVKLTGEIGKNMDLLSVGGYSRHLGYSIPLGRFWIMESLLLKSDLCRTYPEHWSISNPKGCRTWLNNWINYFDRFGDTSMGFNQVKVIWVSGYCWKGSP